MNDIQTKVNFFEWFDNYFKPKILAGRNTNTNYLLLRDKSTNNTQRISNTPPNTPFLTPLTKTHACDIPDTTNCLQQRDKSTNNTQRISNTPPNTPFLTPLTKTHACDISDTTNCLLQKDKSTNNTQRISNTPPNTPFLTPLTKTHACDIPDTSHNKLLPLKQQITDNTHLATRQTLITSQHGQINTIKNNNNNKKDNTHKDKKKPKKDKKDKTPIVDSTTIDPLTKNSEGKITNHKPLCYKCEKLGHYQNNYVSDKGPSNLKTPYLHSEINLLKQEIK